MITNETKEINDINILAQVIQDNWCELTGYFQPETTNGRAIKAYYQHVIKLSQLASEHILCTNEHKPLSAAKKKQTTGCNKKFDQLNSITGIFVDNGTGYRVGLYAKAHCVSEAFIKKLDKLLDLPEEFSIDNMSAWHLFTPENYVTASYVEPRLEKLKQHHAHLGTLKPCLRTFSERIRVWAIIQTVVHSGGRLMQYYDTSTRGFSDRLNTVGLCGLQHIKKSVRNIVLSGYYSHDLSAAAYNILLSLSDDRTKYQTLGGYCLNTKLVREQVANEAQCDVSHVKLAFLFTGFGSRLSIKSDIVKDIQKLLMDGFIDNDPELVIDNVIKSETKQCAESIRKAILANDTFKEFKREYALLAEELIVKFSTEFKQAVEFLNNENNQLPAKSRVKRTDYKSLFMAQLYQKYEIQIIKLIRSTLDNPEHCVMIHDEIVVPHKLNTQELVQLVQETLTIQIPIKSQLISSGS